MPTLWIVELAEGRAHVYVAGVAHLSVPVVELRAGDSYLGLPYEVWAAHVGETVDVAALENASAADDSAAVRTESQLDRQLVERLRRRAGWLFGIPAFIGTLWVLATIDAYPYWGYTGILAFYLIMIITPLVLVWWRITFLMFSQRRMPILAGSGMGWVHITIGVPLVVMGLRSASGTYGEYSDEAYIMWLIVVALGAAFIEGGRSYVRVWAAQERATSSRETTRHASEE